MDLDGVLAVTEFGHAFEKPGPDAVDQVVVPGRNNECHTDATRGCTLPVATEGGAVGVV